MRICIHVYAYWSDAYYVYILVWIYLSCTVDLFHVKDDVQAILRSLGPQCLQVSQTFSHDGMQIYLTHHEPLTLSLRCILNSFPNSFLEFFSYEGFSSSDIRKNEA